MIRVFLLACTLLSVGLLKGQELQRELVWSEFVNGAEQKIPFCTDCEVSFESADLYISYFSERIKGFAHETTEIEITEAVYRPLEVSAVLKKELQERLAASQPEVFTSTQYESGTPHLFVRFRALRVSGNTIEKLERFKIKLTTRSTPLAAPPSARPGRRTSYPSVSVLASGQWYRVAVDREGIYKMDRAYLESLGMNPAEIDPRTIKIYSGHGNILPELNAIDRAKDLQEIPVFVAGEQDGRFDAGDYILFYGQSPSKFVYDSARNDFIYSKHYYARETIYFITFGGIAGKRVTTNAANASQPAAMDVNEFDDVYRHEKDLVNHIKSGKIWYGEHFDRVLNHTITHTFNNRVAGSSVRLRTIMVARSTVASAFTLNLNGQVHQLPMGTTSLSYDMPFIDTPLERTIDFGAVSGNTLNLSVSYNKPLSTSEGWIDYVEFHTKRNLIHSGSQTVFANLASTQVGSARFRLTGSEAVQVWDVTDPFIPRLQGTEFSGNEHVFVANTNGVLRRYISATAYSTPKPLTRINNQNLHGVRDIDYIIVTPSSLRSSAENLAQFHREQSNLSVYVANLQEIYNEFSHGIQDLTAIRDFMKMLWEEASSPAKRPRYLLLFGDASYDYLDIVTNNTNRVPTYQSLNSHVPTVSFCSDDYFVLMDDSEGQMNSTGNIGMLDIAVGRIVANTVAQADAVINKIKNYYSKEAFGNWRNEYTLLADDMDAVWEDVFLKENEEYSKNILEKFPYATFNKIYLDAFEQKSLGGGERYPDAVEAINNGIEKGTLLWSYNGHGGVFGLASERVLEIPQINAWRNKYKLPLFMTATCELSRYDDPAMASGGEATLLNPNGGSIGLLTTTRLVQVSTNSVIQGRFFGHSLYTKDPISNHYTVGHIYKETKNRPNPGTGDRFFTYLGDPALRLAVPRYGIVLDSLNGKSLGEIGADTLKALAKVTFKGRIINDDNSVKSDFNGMVYPTVLDKPVLTQTRANDPNADVLDFELQNNILFKGRSQAVNGRFEFTFIVPKDINYRFDSSRISLYADNQLVDAAGYENRIIIGGSADSSNADNKGPLIELFMNDYTFVNGGMTGKSPLFIAKLFDESGINTAGSGIGREIIATLDKGTQNERTIVLNEYYQASVDSYQEGEIRYRLSNLSEGKHTITLKAWDVHNNSAEATLEFLVEDEKDLILKNVLNYPNPFSTRTEFHFDHNKPGQDLTVHIQIMTIGGRVIKSHFTEMPGAESHLVPFVWDARDEFGDKLSKGVYIYRVRAKVTDGEWVEKYEKLLILN